MVSKIEKLLKVMSELRDPETGCPWDLQQSFKSIVPHTLEEAYEVAEAIETGDLNDLRDELGDLLFQIVFYAQLAEEQKAFDFNQIVDGIVDKLIRRHPHVYGDASVLDAEAQTQAWEQQKTGEREQKNATGGALWGIAKTLPAMTRAMKLQKRAAAVGFDWPDILPVYDKVREELDEVKVEIDQSAERSRIEDEMGDLMFACVNLARHAGINPETALRHANRKFERRFGGMETLVAEQEEQLSNLDLDAWQALWDAVKLGEKGQ